MLGFLLLRVGGGFFNRLFTTVSFEKNSCVVNVEYQSLLMSYVLAGALRSLIGMKVLGRNYET